MQNLGFWAKLKKPIFALAPMANVTDAAFRSMIARHGKPDVMWTEFVSADGLVSAGRDKLLVDFWFGENQRPIVAQLFSAKPEKMYAAAKLVKELGFDGLDINMGCPDRAVMKQGAGGALIQNPKLAAELIAAAKEGSRLPVSVKTRLGVNKMVWEEWLPFLAKQGLAAITVHLRTVKEMSTVPAHWEVMSQITDIRNQISRDRPLIIGNGDVMTLQEAQEKVAATGCDGVMMGRAIFGNPWLFNTKIKVEGLRVKDKLLVMIKHTKLFEQKFAGIKNFETMKKHYKAYVNNFDGAKELRVKLMEEAESATDVERIIKDYLATSVKSA